MTVFCSKMAATRRGRTKHLRLLRRLLRPRSHCPVFSPSRSHSLLPLCRTSCRVKVFVFVCFFVLWLLFLMMFFRSCLSGSHCLCLTGRLKVLAFLKASDAATDCHVKKRKKKSAVFYGTERERITQPPPSSLTSLLVEVCVSVSVRVSLCQQTVSGGRRARWLSCDMCWDFVFGTPLCEKRLVFLSCPLLLLFSPRLTSLSTRHDNPLPPLPPPPVPSPLPPTHL